MEIARPSEKLRLDCLLSKTVEFLADLMIASSRDLLMQIHNDSMNGEHGALYASFLADLPLETNRSHRFPSILAYVENWRYISGIELL